MTFTKGKPIPDIDVMSLDGATPASRLDGDIALDDPRRIAFEARQAEISKNNPISGALGLGKNVMELGEAFGIDKRTVGNMLLKSIFTGKFEFPGMKSETAKRKKVEVAVDQIIKLAWTMFGIFMIFQVFIVVVELVT